MTEILSQSSALPDNLPSGPYPGLRPFVERENALLFGREAQIAEVVNGLRGSQFIAVIGGSGCGKSSLIRAGVVPALRSFQLENAGDFWIPVVFTPGTNPVASGQGLTRHSPITRFAWKFARLLRTNSDNEKQRAHIEEIARVFREDGFGGVIDTYVEELDVPEGLSPKDARLLFVIDQFEELFHPTNEVNEDCAALVDQVIRHFRAPHERSFVVLTMRSEYLNDCASYLELPDAINKSSYLVRRLDSKQLRDAIVKPAERFMRLQQRSRVRNLPNEVVFDEDVVRRLLKDTESITQDPDHLPLLQHLLARLWSKACEREGKTCVVPATIKMCDLEAATTASDLSKPVDLAKNINTLRASLENWGEFTFDRTAPELQPRIEAILRELAFKNPNTGQYTQRRINVDECESFLGSGATRNTLWGLVKDGLVGTVDYLYWDNEDPNRVTLKVSHESFIRGWFRFRNLADKESDRLEEFVSVLRKCARWSMQNQTSTEGGSYLLLEASELRRFDEAQLGLVIEDSKKLTAWFDMLRRFRWSADVVAQETNLNEFLSASRKKKQISDITANRYQKLKLFFMCVAAMLVAMVVLSVAIQQPTMDRMRQYFTAGEDAANASIPGAFPDFETAKAPLDTLIGAANVFVGYQATDPTNITMNWRSQARGFAFNYLDWIPFVESSKSILTTNGNRTEPAVNWQLRRLLTSTIWRGTVGQLPEEDRLSQVDAGPERSCEVNKTQVPGQLFLNPDEKRKVARRGVFVPGVSTDHPDVELLAASVDAGTKKCVVHEGIYTVKQDFQPKILLDRHQGYLIVSTRASTWTQGGVALHEIEWSFSPDSNTWRAKLVPEAHAVLYGADAIETVQKYVGDKVKVRSTESWYTLGGRTFLVGNQKWRIISKSPSRVPTGDVNPNSGQLPPREVKQGIKNWKELEQTKSSICKELAKKSERDGQSDKSGSMNLFDDTKNCYQIKFSKRTSTDGATALNSPPEESQVGWVVLAVDVMPNGKKSRITDADFLTPRQVLPQLNSFWSDKTTWYAGSSSLYDGWVAVIDPSADNKEQLAIPWSTSALLRLAKDIEKDQPVRALTKNPAPSAQNIKSK